MQHGSSTQSFATAASYAPLPPLLTRSLSSTDATSHDMFGANWGLRLDLPTPPRPPPRVLRRSQTAEPGLEHWSSPHDESEPPPPVVASAMLHALRDDSEDVVKPPATAHMLRRSVTFSGDHAPDSPLMPPPPILGRASSDNRRQSDLAAVANAWGEPPPPPSSPSPFSPRAGWGETTSPLAPSGSPLPPASPMLPGPPDLSAMMAQMGLPQDAAGYELALMQQQWLLYMQDQLLQQQQQLRQGGGRGFRRPPRGMDPGVPAFMPTARPPPKPASALLQEHKMSGKRLSAAELAGHVVEFARDSHGSRLIQYKMETGTTEERRAFVAEALPHMLSLARDLFGNYVLQNFFDHCEPVQRDEMAKALLGSISSLCEHPHGCRVVQRALSCTEPARRNDMIDELLQLDQPNGQPDAVVMTCARDAHATHVLQKAVQLLQAGLGHRPSTREDEVLSADPPSEQHRSQRALAAIEACIERDAMAMMTHQQASRLVQRTLGSCEVSTSPRLANLVAEIFRNIDVLAVHQNGNFVLQHILEFGTPALRTRIQTYACGNAVRLAMHKFGSHLVEKCLAYATPVQVAAFVDRFLLPPPQDLVAEFRLDEADAQMALSLLMGDSYGNFVVQKVYDVSRGEARLKLSREIRARTASLSKFSYGRHILSHINRGGDGGIGAPPPPPHFQNQGFGP